MSRFAPLLRTSWRLARSCGRASRSFASSPDIAVHPNIGRFSSELDLQFISRFDEPFLTFRVMDENGNILDPSLEPDVSKEKCQRMYKTMVELNVTDSILYQAQRQGRLSFYMTNYGEEATHIGSAAALEDEDVVFGQYREAGVLLWRGYSMQEMCDQCVGNRDDSNKGRMMPVHYGSKRHNFHTISSPLATQLPQAAGAAYAMKLQGRQACVVCYFGDGAASEGDFHGALNFASTLDCPVIFFCRNNGYAISTPIREQYRGDGIAVRGVSYNIRTARCDGNDVWAVHKIMDEARKIAISQKVPVLIEAMTYRGGNHSTSDDASRYRGNDEVSSWKLSNNPLARMRMFMEKKNWWDDQQETALRESARTAIVQVCNFSFSLLLSLLLFFPPPLHHKVPASLKEQEETLLEHLKEFGSHYPTVN
ncbi:hypothetical protein GUITHDRAFT_156001 [Guillardia theta CCMP2712]|uniref:2-oxoisovalerate dehydrogenase subunit alpha n=1 Tax=Guillardia theta (strain CCMP2712) TaxID=905079 RepID=L1IBT9_GUITC|nr:hypothetical protein GUITHDRAFT_156001 [Guillardia theta CCMP2712]EKX33562.1 hypothetical protein GUITHDRAFT_156001 [Guillardia theta CCMP2712]|eukprot:XP_005820542.1 hypothetical protein GUITHDRAFT_156001 [Guillardia theta CCMP2712]